MAAVQLIETLSDSELDFVMGGNAFNDLSDGMFAAGAVAAGLGAVPTPASGALFGFAAMTTLMGVGFNYLSRRVQP